MELVQSPEAVIVADRVNPVEAEQDEIERTPLERAEATSVTHGERNILHLATEAGLAGCNHRRRIIYAHVCGDARSEVQGGPPAANTHVQHASAREPRIELIENGTLRCLERTLVAVSIHCTAALVEHVTARPTKGLSLIHI